MSHDEFADRYRYLSTCRRDGIIDTKEICRRIVNSYTKMDGEIKIGNSQIYATEHGIELAERWKLRIRHQAASVIQRWWRDRLRRKNAALLLQNWWRTIIQRRAVNKIKRWWIRKRSTAQTLSKVRQIFLSVRLIQKNVRRWLKNVTKKRNAKANSSVIHSPPDIVQTELKIVQPVQFKVSPKLGENNNCAKPTEPCPNLISLQLSRINFFYSDGIISIRRPPTVS